MPLSLANLDSDHKPKANNDTLSAKLTRCFELDPVTSAPVMRYVTSSTPLPELHAVGALSQDIINGFQLSHQPVFSRDANDGLTKGGTIAHVTERATDHRDGSELEPVAGALGDGDESMSMTSEASDDNVSIPHDDLSKENTGSTDIHQEQQDANTSTSLAAIGMPPAIEAQLEKWYAVHGRGTPPCATSTIPQFLYSRNVSGEIAYFVHKSGERLKVCLHPLFDGPVTQTSLSRQKIIVAQGPSQGPFIINYASQKNKRMTGTSYKIWRGVKGGDKHGFELTPSVYKRYNSTGTATPKPIPTAKQVLPKKGNFRDNRYCAADGTPKSDTGSRPRMSAAVGNNSTITSTYNFRPSKRPKQDDESPANYSKLLAAFSSSAEPSSSRKQAVRQKSGPAASHHVIEHIQHNAVFLFYPKKSPQPRVRLFGACNTIQKLFAQALAGDVFDEDAAAAKVLSVRIAGQQKSKAVVEDDEQDFEDVVDELKKATCWSQTNGGLSGSCTVEVRAKS